MAVSSLIGQRVARAIISVAELSCLTFPWQEPFTRPLRPQNAPQATRQPVTGIGKSSWTPTMAIASGPSIGFAGVVQCESFAQTVRNAIAPWRSPEAGYSRPRPRVPPGPEDGYRPLATLRVSMVQR